MAFYTLDYLLDHVMDLSREALLSLLGEKYGYQEKFLFFPIEIEKRKKILRLIIQTGKFSREEIMNFIKEGFYDPRVLEAAIETGKFSEHEVWSLIQRNIKFLSIKPLDFVWGNGIEYDKNWDVIRAALKILKFGHIFDLINSIENKKIIKKAAIQTGRFPQQEMIKKERIVEAAIQTGRFSQQEMVRMVNYIFSIPSASNLNDFDDIKRGLFTEIIRTNSLSKEEIMLLVDKYPSLGAIKAAVKTGKFSPKEMIDLIERSSYDPGVIHAAIKTGKFSLGEMKDLIKRSNSISAMSIVIETGKFSLGEMKDLIKRSNYDPYVTHAAIWVGNFSPEEMADFIEKSEYDHLVVSAVRKKLSPKEMMDLIERRKLFQNPHYNPFVIEIAIQAGKLSLKEIEELTKKSDWDHGWDIDIIETIIETGNLLPDDMSILRNLKLGGLKIEEKKDYVMVASSAAKTGRLSFNDVREIVHRIIALYNSYSDDSDDSELLELDFDKRSGINFFIEKAINGGIRTFSFNELKSLLKINEGNPGFECAVKAAINTGISSDEIMDLIDKYPSIVAIEAAIKTGKFSPGELQLLKWKKLYALKMEIEEE